MLKIILIDDEPNAIKSLEWEIANFCKDVEVLETFLNPKEAIAYLKHNDPNCVFLDVEMPEMDGFQLLDHFQNRRFCVISSRLTINMRSRQSRKMPWIIC